VKLEPVIRNAVTMVNAIRVCVNVTKIILELFVSIAESVVPINVQTMDFVIL